MPQNAYDLVYHSLDTAAGDTIEYFAHASDTTNGRNAGYAAYVVKRGGVFYARTAYGAIGTRYRETDLGAYAGLYNAEMKAKDALYKKLKKNYKEDTHVIQMKTTAQVKPKSAVQQFSNPYGIKDSIPVFSHYTPGQVEIDPALPNIYDESIALEWYPNRMRMKIFAFHNSAFGIYTTSGQLEEAREYPKGYDNTSSLFMEIASNGLLFIGYTDPNDNIVLLRYISEVTNQRGTEVYHYSKQRNITLMVLYTLTDNSGISITSVDSPIYVNPKIALTTDKEHALKHRVALNRFANNLAMFVRHDNMAVLNCIER